MTAFIAIINFTTVKPYIKNGNLLIDGKLTYAHGGSNLVLGIGFLILFLELIIHYIKEKVSSDEES